MVHRQRAVPDGAAAVVADAVRDAPLPPLTAAQLARVRPLAPERRGIDGRVEIDSCVASAVDSCSHSRMSHMTCSSARLRSAVASRTRSPFA